MNRETKLSFIAVTAVMFGFGGMAFLVWALLFEVLR